MSIIYETLSRLEKEGAGQADHIDRVGVTAPAGRPKGSPAGARATVMVLVLTGIGLVVWHPNSPLSGFSQLPFTDAHSVSVASEKSDHELPFVSPGEQVSHQIQPAIAKNETVTTEGQAAVPLVQGSTEETVEVDGQPAKAEQGPIDSQAHEKTLEVASAGPVEVEVAAAKSSSSPALSGQSPAQAHQASPQTQPNEQIAATAAAESEKAEVPAAKSSSAPAVSEKPPAQAHQVSLQTQPGEQSVAVADAKIGMVVAPSPKPKPKLAVPYKHQAKAQVAGAGEAAAPNTVDTVIEQAGYALSRGRFQQALVALEELAPVPERRVDYWLIKGNAYLRVGQLDAAEEALASAQRLAPTNAQIAVQRAILKQEKGDHVAALQILQDAGKRNPDVPEIFLNQGYSEQALGAVQDARRSFRIFLRITEGRSLYAKQRQLVDEWLAQFPATQF